MYTINELDLYKGRVDFADWKATQRASQFETFAEAILACSNQENEFSGAFGIFHELMSSWDNPLIFFMRGKFFIDPFSSVSVCPDCEGDGAHHEGYSDNWSVVKCNTCDGCGFVDKTDYVAMAQVKENENQSRNDDTLDDIPF